nr:site-2 protease family protein [uncultured Gemmiger sp.]
MTNVLLTTIAAIVVFGLVVLVHEAGHFLAAHRVGMWVQEFSIGFGPALWSRVKNGTRYSIRLLPLGGYNLLPGENPDEGEEGTEADAAGSFSRPHASYDRRRPLLPAAVKGKFFDEAPPSHRFFVILCGAMMNFVLGYFLLVVLLCGQDAITSCMVYDFLGDAPASEASGLQAGDEILAVNGRACFVAEDIVYELQRTPDYTASMTVLRDGRITTLPAVHFDSATAEDGTKTMVLDFQVYGIAKTPRAVASWAGRYFLYYARAILRGFLDMFTGRVSINQLSGPVGVVSAVSQAVRYGWKDVVSLAALISVNLGIFNLLPIPGLDGFKLLFLAVEWVSGKTVPARVQAVLNAAGIVALLALMILVTFQDITKFV